MYMISVVSALLMRHVVIEMILKHNLDQTYCQAVVCAKGLNPAVEHRQIFAE